MGFGHHFQQAGSRAASAKGSASLDSDLKWLIAREIPHLRRYALALTNDPTRADDLVQDCLERAIRKQHLIAQRGRLRGWLFKVMYNVFLNGLANAEKARRQVPIDGLEHPSLAERPQQEEQVAYVEIIRALHELPAQQRAAIVLVALEDMPYDEAADVLGIPIGTLRSRLSRGRESLRSLSTGHARQRLIRRVK